MNAQEDVLPVQITGLDKKELLINTVCTSLILAVLIASIIFACKVVF